MEPVTGPTISILAYNTHLFGQRGWADFRDEERAAGMTQAVLASDPDIVVLSEVWDDAIADKLAGIQGFLRLATDARDSLENASPDDTAMRQHQYQLIVIAALRTNNMVSEANQCAGDILTFAGDTEATVSVDPSIPQEEDVTDDTQASDDLSRLTPDQPLPETTPFQ